MLDKGVEQDDFSKTAETGEECVRVAGAFAAVHDLDAAGAELSFACEPEESVSTLLERSGSGVGLDTETVLITVPVVELDTSTWISTTASPATALAGSAPSGPARSHVTTCPAAEHVHDPRTEVEPVKVRPAGSVSIRRTGGAASDGPALSTVSR